jgi:uncharacterized protein (TIGR00255 family)
MTGFGRGEARDGGTAWVVECASVNRKQLEVAASLPRELSELEAAVRGKVGALVSRGRVNVSIKSDTQSVTAGQLRVDEALARQYLDALQRLSTSFDIRADLSAADIARWPGVFQTDAVTTTADSAWPVIERALDAALARLIAMREAEGAHLKADIVARIAALDAHLQSIAALAPAVPETQRKNLQQRLADAGLPLPLDDERLVKEIAIFADRSDISEELSRAESHLKQFRAYLASAEPLGRNMDFLTQELFREFNTMGSKANNAAISHHVVTAKTEIEKIREQVQNVE